MDTFSPKFRRNYSAKSGNLSNSGFLAGKSRLYRDLQSSRLWRDYRVQKNSKFIISRTQSEIYFAKGENSTKCLIFRYFRKIKLFSKKVKFFMLKNFNTQSLTFSKFRKSHFNTQSLFFGIFCIFSRYLPTNFVKNFKSETVY